MKMDKSNDFRIWYVEQNRSLLKNHEVAAVFTNAPLSLLALIEWLRCWQIPTFIEPSMHHDSQVGGVVGQVLGAADTMEPGVTLWVIS